MIYDYKVELTITDYATNTRTYKPNVSRRSYKIKANSAIEAERQLEESLRNQFELRNEKRQIALKGKCYIVEANGQIVDEYDYSSAFEYDTRRNGIIRLNGIQRKNPAHPFEAAGLGIAPFHFVEAYDKYYEGGGFKQVGGACDYCGTGIVTHCVIEDVNGKRFVVGNECVKKTDDRKLISDVKQAVNKLKLEKRHNKESLGINQALELLQRDDIKVALALQPHPNSYYAAQGKTLLDWVQWMFQNGGNRGKLDAAAVIGNNDINDVTERDIANFYDVVAKQTRLVEENQERAGLEKLQQAEIEYSYAEANKDVIYELKRTFGDFASSMAEKLRSEPLSSLSQRQFDIVRDIYAKAFGKRNSKAYNAAVEKIWDLYENS